MPAFILLKSLVNKLLTDQNRLNIIGRGKRSSLSNSASLIRKKVLKKKRFLWDSASDRLVEQESTEEVLHFTSVSKKME